MGLVFNPFTGNFDFTGGSGGGGGGTPGGAVGSIQFNDSGSFGGFGSWDGSYASVANLAVANGTIPPADFPINGEELVFAPIVSSGTVTDILHGDDFTLAAGMVLEIQDAHGSQDASDAQVIGLRVAALDGQVNSGPGPGQFGALRAAAYQRFDNSMNFLFGVYAEARGLAGTVGYINGTFSSVVAKAPSVVPYMVAYEDYIEVNGVTVPFVYGSYYRQSQILGGAITEGGAIFIEQQTGPATAYTINAAASTAPSVFGGSITATDFIVSDGKAFKTDTTTAHTGVFQAYDVDGTAYKTFATLTNGNTPTFTITPPSGGTVTVNATTLQQGGKSLVLSGDLTTTGAFNPTFAIPSSSTWTFPSGGGTLSTSTGTVTSIATTSPISGGTITSTGTISLLTNVDFGFTAGQTITAPTGSTALTLAGGSQNVASFPALSATQTWNNSGVTFTLIKGVVTNTASAAGSLLIDLQAGSATRFSVSKSGYLVLSDPSNGTVGMAPGLFNNELTFIPSANSPSNGTLYIDGNNHWMQARSDGAFVWAANTTNTSSSTIDVKLFRDAANTLALRNAAAAQEFRPYGYFSSATSRAYGTVQTALSALTLSGATTATGNIIPVGCFVIGVATTTTTTITGASGYQVGDGSDADRWGDITGTAVGTDSDNTDSTANPTGYFAATQGVTLTAKTSNFTGGVVQVVVYYLTTGAD